MTTITLSTGSLVELAGQAEDYLSRLGPASKDFGGMLLSDRDLSDPKRRSGRNAVQRGSRQCWFQENVSRVSQFTLLLGDLEDDQRA